MKFNALPRTRNRHNLLPTLAIALIVGSALILGSAHFATASCVYYSFEHGRPIQLDEATCKEASEWPDFDSTALGDQALATRDAAAEEAAGWEDFDSTAIGDQVIASRAAADEAATWPNLDSTAIGDQVIAAREAEVAGSPQFQSTSAL